MTAVNKTFYNPSGWRAKSTIEKISQNFIARNYFGIPLNPRIANKHLRQDDEFSSVIGVCAAERGEWVSSLSARSKESRGQLSFPFCSLQSHGEIQLCESWLISFIATDER